MFDVIMVGLIITGCAYLIFPICYRCANGKVNSKLANKIAIWNSVVVILIFCILRSAITLFQTFFGSFGPAILYYFINKAILSEKAKNDNIADQTNNSENNNKLEKDNKIENINNTEEKNKSEINEEK